MSGQRDEGLLERESGPEELQVVGLREDIRCAARTDVPVLITGRPIESHRIACAIDQHQSRQCTVEVVDCRQPGAMGRLASYILHDHPSNTAGRITLLLQEVHALSASDQVQFDRWLSELRVSRCSGPRIVVSASAPLFECVLNGSFEERLYYRLSVFQVVA